MASWASFPPNANQSAVVRRWVVQLTGRKHCRLHRGRKGVPMRNTEAPLLNAKGLQRGRNENSPCFPWYVIYLTASWGRRKQNISWAQLSKRRKRKSILLIKWEFVGIVFQPLKCTYIWKGIQNWAEERRRIVSR